MKILTMIFHPPVLHKKKIPKAVNSASPTKRPITKFQNLDAPLTPGYTKKTYDDNWDNVMSPVDKRVITVVYQEENALGIKKRMVAGYDGTFILFTAKPDGRVSRRILADYEEPPVPIKDGNFYIGPSKKDQQGSLYRLKKGI